MIYIEECRPAYKMPGLSSFFIKFDYKANIVDTIKNLPNYAYHKKLNCWEIPTTCLARAIELLSNLDSITITLCEDEDEETSVNFSLSNYKTPPYKYQLDGIEYGLNHNKWLLLDAPGLGKSLQMIYLAEELKKRDNIEHCLIICGINTLKHNWKKEIEKHSSLSCKILGERTTKKGKKIIGSINDRLEDLQEPINEFCVITNIETLRNDDIVKEIKSSKINKFDMIVADELHKMKSPTSQQGKNFLKLDAKYEIGLSGTLLLNNPLDAYVPLKWIKAENSTYTNFKFYYCMFSGPFNNILTGYRNIEVLKDELDKYSLRRNKDLLDLPEKNIIHEYLTMEDDQALFYENIVNGVKDQVDKVELKTTTLLSMVTRLRQATADPSILSSENISSVKIDRAIELAKEILDNGEKVVIYSNFKKPLDKVMEELKAYDPLLCTGDVNDELISYNVDNFQNFTKNKVMCCTISKMGTGITLTAASYAIFMDSSWTAATNEQAEDRIHRIGSNKPVFIYYLWTENTIDEHVKELVEDKEAISDFVIDDKITNKSIESLKKYILDL